jgi:hypothetical protein
MKNNPNEYDARTVKLIDGLINFKKHGEASEIEPEPLIHTWSRDLIFQGRRV